MQLEKESRGIKKAVGRLGSVVSLLVFALLLAVALLAWVQAAWGWQPAWLAALLGLLEGFSSIFLGIFIEAVPYLLLGTLASGLVEVFIKSEDLASFLPRNRTLSVMAGSFLGLFFPVCECGTVPLARRFIRKGVSVPVGIAFLLAAPVINPIVIASTLSAFGNSLIFWLRLGLTLLLAILIASLFSLEADGSRLLRREDPLSQPLHLDSLAPVEAEPPSLGTRLKRMVTVATDDFFEMGRYLVTGAALAAVLQTLVPQAWLLAIGKGPILSVVALAVLAALLSICSTVDAFIALAFLGTFSTGAVVAFLVFGPMVDIKAILMYLRVFNRKTVAYLSLLPFLLSVLCGIVINLVMS
jgi:uncharacterized membrane protein YraQ (UPF0718 family)